MSEVINNFDEEIIAGRSLRESKNQERITKDIKPIQTVTPSEPVNKTEAVNGVDEGVIKDRKKESVVADKIRQSKQEASKAVIGKIEEKIMMPARQQTSNALRFAWLNIIDSIGLTFIYVNIHIFFLHKILPSVFCAPGEEWAPKEITAMGGKKVKEMGEKIGPIETALVIGIDFLLAAILLILLVLIVIMVDVYVHPLKLWSFGWDIIGSAFNSLFR